MVMTFMEVNTVVAVLVTITELKKILFLTSFILVKVKKKKGFYMDIIIKDNILSNSSIKETV